MWLLIRLDDYEATSAFRVCTQFSIALWPWKACTTCEAKLPHKDISPSFFYIASDTRVQARVVILKVFWIGSQDAVGAGGPLLAILGFIILPIFWSVPEALITAELATAFPEDSGYVAWVTAAFGPFWGYQVGHHHPIVETRQCDWPSKTAVIYLLIP